MTWQLRTLNGTDGVEYETLEAVMEQARTVTHRYTARGCRAENRGGRVFFYDGFKVIDELWVVAGDGTAVPIP
jgi:hypothetical protein